MQDFDLSRLRKMNAAALSGKIVLVRADLNVPMQRGAVSDTTRLDRFAPTARALAAAGAIPVILSHFGRPQGQVRPDMSLRPVVGPLATAIGREIEFIDTDWRNLGRARDDLASARPGDVFLAENTRFHPGEEANDPDLVATMASLGTAYVNDAFSCAHRAHASTEGLAHRLQSMAGPQMCAEIDALRAALENPARPVAALVGGAKVSSKISVLTSLLGKVDQLIIGGGMANTFLHAQGIDVGKSLCEPDLAQTARDVMGLAQSSDCEIVLPVDAVVANEFAAGAPSRTVALDAVPADAMILDVGPASIADLQRRFAQLKTVLWNGPLGAFEIDPFGTGTFAAAQMVADRTAAGEMTSVAGGGDTVAALNQAGVADRFTYVSTAGGAFLEWLEGRELPGVAALVGTG